MSDLSEISKPITAFVGKAPDDFNRFVGILRDKYMALLELLSGLQEYGDIRFTQGQIYILREILKVLDKEASNA